MSANLVTFARRLRPTAEDFAAAGAWHDNTMLLQVKAAQPRRPRPAKRRPRRRPPAGTGGALLLVAAVVLALVWSNIGSERDLGELRDGRRLTVPVVAALAGMGASAVVYLAVAAGGPGAAGWGVAISTDTALALGALTLAAGRAERLRVFLLTLLLTMRRVAAGQFRARGTSAAALTPLSVLTGVALWLALFESGFDPVVSGLLIGLLTNAYEPKDHGPARVSPNDRLLHRLRPWTSGLVVPLFALANAGLHLDGRLLASAATSPVTWGIVLAFAVGKPLGIVLASGVASRRAVLKLRSDELRGTAMSAGVGFTVSLLIASRAFDGALLDQAKVGILATALLAPVLTAAALAPWRPAVTAPCPA
jgi:Na+/H+ antiporter NhaA